MEIQMSERELSYPSSVVIQPRLVSDAHGCILHRRDGAPAEPMDRLLTDEEQSYLRSIVERRDLAHLIGLTSIGSRKREESFNFQVAHRLPSSVADNPTQAEMYERLHKKTYIDSYDVPPVVKLSCSMLGLPEVYRAGGRLTIATGTPQCCAYLFKQHLQKERVWENLDPNFSIFMNPYQEKPRVWPFGKVYSAVSKVAAVGVCSIFDGVTPWVVEDNLDMARYQALINGASVYIPGSDLGVISEAVGNLGGKVITGRSYPGIIQDYMRFLQSNQISLN